jgi:hypothetical protein
MWMHVRMCKCLFWKQFAKKLIKLKKKEKNRMWTHDMSVSRCNEGEFDTLFQRLCPDPMKHKQYFHKKYYCVSRQVRLYSVFAPPMWLRLSSGIVVTPKRVGARLGHGTNVPSLSDPRCPALDLTGTCVDAFCPPHGIRIERTIFIFGLKWPDRDLASVVPHSVNQPYGACPIAVSLFSNVRISELRICTVQLLGPDQKLMNRTLVATSHRTLVATRHNT